LEEKKIIVIIFSHLPIENVVGMLQKVGYGIHRVQISCSKKMPFAVPILRLFIAFFEF